MKDGVKSEEIKHEWDSVRDRDSCDVYNNSYKTTTKKSNETISKTYV